MTTMSTESTVNAEFVPAVTSFALKSSLTIECPSEETEFSNYFNPSSIKGIKLTQEKKQPFPTRVERGRRRCLTSLPGSNNNLVRDSLLPSHLSKLLFPNMVGTMMVEDRATPTKETILALLATSSASKPFCSIATDSRKINHLPNLAGGQHHSNQHEHELKENSNQQPARRRVRSTYGVRLETIRLGFETTDENVSVSAKCHSHDEYQPARKEGLRLAPLIHPNNL